MTAQEQQLIDELVDRIRNTNVQDKDAAAEQRLQQGLANSPDALYILAQTVIVQKYGLEQAQSRMAAMQSELDSLRQQAAHPSGGSFLSHIFGGSSSSQAPQVSPAPPSQQGWQSVTNPGYPQAGSVPPPAAYPPPSYGQPYGYGQPSGFGSGGGGFLQGALQTAAGVAMGEMAFESMESLFHGFGGGGGYGGYGGRGFEDGRPSETIINNYNDGDEPHHEHSEGSHDRDDSSFYNPNDDASRDSDKGSSFADTGAGTNDSSADNDDNQAGDSGNDDSSSSFDSGDDGSSIDSGDDGGSSGDDGNY